MVAIVVTDDTVWLVRVRSLWYHPLPPMHGPYRTIANFSKVRAYRPPNSDHKIGTTLNMSDRRGKEIKFVRGQYAGLTGWVDNQAEESANLIAVIVHKWTNKKGKKVDKATRVKRTIVRDREEPQALIYSMALLQQHPKIEMAMDSLCKKLAMCGLETDDNAIMIIFKKKLQEKVDEQSEKGGNAVWYHVEYVHHSI